MRPPHTSGRGMGGPRGKLSLSVEVTSSSQPFVGRSTKTMGMQPPASSFARAKPMSAALAHGAATEVGNHRKAKEAAKELIALADAVVRSGAILRQQFLALLDDSNPWVRSWCASHAKSFAPEAAMAALQKVMREERGPVVLGAQVLLGEWGGPG